jgi:rhodanese-related sulfurtransferase
MPVEELRMKEDLTVHELKEKLQQHEPLQLVDVRSPGEFSAGHIPGATNMPMEELESRLDDLRAPAPVVLVCQSGRRAGISCGLLRSHRENVLVLEGGTKAWADEGLPLVASAKTRWSLERQVRLAAGLLVLLGVGLSLAVNPYWLGLSAFVGAGLTFAGLTDICGMGLLFAAMPWNKPSPGKRSPTAVEV